jgi:hypothetical protein
MFSKIFSKFYNHNLKEPCPPNLRLSTLKATRACSSLPEILSRAQPLRARLEKWKLNLPFDPPRLTSMDDEELELYASLRLSYLTLEILIYRVLLRPLMHGAWPQDEEVLSASMSILENSYICSQFGAQLVGSLKSRHFAVFWMPCKPFPCHPLRHLLCGLHLHTCCKS